MSITACTRASCQSVRLKACESSEAKLSFEQSNRPWIKSWDVPGENKLFPRGQKRSSFLSLHLYPLSLSLCSPFIHFLEFNMRLLRGRGKKESCIFTYFQANFPARPQWRKKSPLEKDKKCSFLSKLLKIKVQGTAREHAGGVKWIRVRAPICVKVSWSKMLSPYQRCLLLDGSCSEMQQADKRLARHQPRK